MSKVLEFTDDNFETELYNVKSPVIVDFYAPWCGHCRTQLPIIEQLADEMTDKAVFAKINVDENREKADEFFISGIPAILVFKNGKLVEQKSGVQSFDELKRIALKYSDN